VVTNAGGPGILLADACEAHGLSLPPLAPQTAAALRAFLPREGQRAEPGRHDRVGARDHYELAIELVGRESETSTAVVAIYVPPLVTRPESVAAAIRARRRQAPR